ncbi:hypothetical protein F7725_017563 [Dissostichus mawsoni]|uniref:Uncharacterized protein n=1 Tax=Dissostichus mawsoni TaxID=36200 RepID=A0A7J5Z5G5_DISMA|nr:hypothetical protein F7725_017563 [Dissostichus mawsoni]
MHALLLLSCLVLAATDHFLASAHMIPDESLATNRVVLSNALSQSLDIAPLLLLLIAKNSEENMKTKKQKKRKKKHPPPPANCVPLGEAVNLQTMCAVISVRSASVGSSELSASVGWETQAAEKPAAE